MLKRFNWPNNKIRYFGLFLGTLIVLGSFFVGANYVLALDDNYQVPACGPANCDANQPVCSSYSKTFIYNINAWQGNGNPSCCGDDSQEDYRFCRKSPNVAFSCVSSDKSCCTVTGGGCVYQGSCYPTEGVYNLPVPSGGDSELVYCDDLQWLDCDELASPSTYCGCPYVVAGESGVGEYTDTSTQDCCGDDANEYYNAANGKCYKSAASAPVCGDNANTMAGSVERDSSSSACGGSNFSVWRLTNGNAGGACWKSGRDNPYLCCGDDSNESPNYRATAEGGGLPYFVSFDTSTSDLACCLSESYCVYNGSCYFGGNPGSGDIEHTVNNENLACVATLWIDLDTNETICNYLSYNWSAAGESGVGEYTSQSSQPTQCCGDDASENYAQLCPGG